MEFDSSADERDKYNRYLAWVWIDDELLQNLLVENGLAEIYMMQNNYKYAGTLQEIQENAKDNKLGIWSYETNNTQISGNENQITESNKAGSKNNNLFYIIIGIIIVLIMGIFCITDTKRKKEVK